MKFKCLVIDPPYGFNDKLAMSDVPRSAEANYSTLSLDDIKNLKINDISEKGAILSLWVPSSLLQDGLDLMKKYGYTQKQTYIWVKSKIDPFEEIRDSLYSFYKKELKTNLKTITSDFTFKKLLLNSNNLKEIAEKSYNILNSMMSFGMGRLFRQCHELALIGTNNNKIYKDLMNKSQRSVSLAPNPKHSEKPEHLQDSLDIMFSVNKIEIFARRQRKGWVCLGNEAPMTYGEDITVSLDKIINLKKDDEIKLLELINDYDDSKSSQLFDFWGKL